MSSSSKDVFRIKPERHAVGHGDTSTLLIPTMLHVGGGGGKTIQVQGGKFHSKTQNNVNFFTLFNIHTTQMLTKLSTKSKMDQSPTPTPPHRKKKPPTTTLQPEKKNKQKKTKEKTHEETAESTMQTTPFSKILCICTFVSVSSSTWSKTASVLPFLWKSWQKWIFC